MSSYFIPGLSAAQKTRLREYGVEFYDFTLGNEEGAILQDGYIEAAMTILGAKIVSRRDTNYDGIQRLKIDDRNLPGESSGQSAEVTAEKWQNGSKNKNGMMNVAKHVLLPYLQQDIVLHNPNNVAAPIEDGKLHIHIYSSPAPCARGVTPPEQLWGIPVQCRDGAWPASGRGTAIWYQPANYAVAELVGPNNLYIHHNLVRNGSEYDEMIFAAILRETLRLLRPSQPPERARRLFVDECSKSFVRALADAGRTEGDARELGKDLQKLVRAAEKEEQKVFRNEGVSLEQFGEEYDGLLAIPKVKDVRVENGAIVVYTRVLYARDDRSGVYHEIGAFKIHLDPNRTSPLWFNQTRLVHGMKPDQHAPHVWSNGTACLGSTEVVFAQLFSTRQWAIAAQLAIEFVEKANTVNDIAGQRVHCWPAASTSAALSAEGAPAKPDLRDVQHQKFRQEYIAACSSRVTELVQQSRKDLISYRKQIEELQFKIVRRMRTDHILRCKAAGEQFCDREQLGREFDALLKSPRVTGVTIVPGQVLVYTDKLSCTDPRTGQRHELGNFLIGIFTDGQSDCVQWVNLSRQVDGCLRRQHAPHVVASGRACFASVREAFPDLIANLQFSIVAQLAIDFIEQVNVDDPAGKQIIKWPLATN
jgi:hypothetical protein